MIFIYHKKLQQININSIKGEILQRKNKNMASLTPNKQQAPCGEE